MDFLSEKRKVKTQILDNEKLINIKKKSIPNRKISLFSNFSMRQKSIKESIKINWISYTLLWLQNWRKNKHDEIFKNFEISQKIKQKVFNEYTFYKLYFEMEKFKMIFFTPLQAQAFNHIKINYSSMFEENKRERNLAEIKEVYLKIKENKDELSMKLTRLLLKNN